MKARKIVLTRPVGRPSPKAGGALQVFLYREARWTTARRAVAKVEFHSGERFPRVGFIVINPVFRRAGRSCGSTTSGVQRNNGLRKAS